MIGPAMLPSPPRMTTANMTMRTLSVKLLDVTASWIAAKIAPQSPASPAPIRIARRLSRLTGMLITSAARGSSRSARQARPVRDRFAK